MPDRQEQWAVFWCSLLGPLLYGEVPPEEAGPFLNQLASTEHLFPDGQRRPPVAGHGVAEVEAIPQRRFRAALPQAA